MLFTTLNPVQTTTPAPRRGRSRLLLLFLALALGVPAGFAVARMFPIPLVTQLDTYRPSIITRLYDHKGRVFFDYAIQRRTIVAKKDISPKFVQAVIATEDSNFYTHGGIDPRAIFRAAVKDAIARKKIEGASTLTQQLAKQVFLTPEKSWRRKLKEAFFAVEIEKNFTKDQIFEMYANQIYLGHGAYGVEAGSRLYFGKHSRDLTTPEAAVLAGMIRRPMYYSPINNPENAISRRNHVLRRMLERKYITAADYQKFVSSPLVLGSYRDETPRIGAYFAEEVRQYLEKRYGADDLYQSGLNVYTTMDLDMQISAEKALRKGLRAFDRRRGFRRPTRNLIREGIDPATYVDPAWDETLEEDELYPAVVTAVSKKSVDVRVGAEKVTLEPSAYSWTRKTSMSEVLKEGDIVTVRFENDEKTKSRKWLLDQKPQVQGAVVVLDVKSGEVRALVGGYDFRDSKFNRAVQSLRQTGSIFKPFVYAAAFEKGYTPADTLFDSPVAIRVGNQMYAPRNYYGKYSGIVTIQRALELSINIPAVKSYMMVGGANVIDLARRCGITAPLPQYPSLALGAAGISPLEMSGAFNVFANQGVYVKPRFMRKITDATQKTLEENYPELSEAMSAQNAYVMSHVLQGTIDRGTAYAAHTLPGALAGKTGTTNGFTDAWFVGFSPEYTVGVWLGYDDPSRSLGSGATGADVALPIWIDVFKDIDAKKLRPAVKDKFDVPPGVVVLPMDLKSGRRGVGPCGRVVEAAFVAGTEPQHDCGGSDVAAAKLPFHLQQQFYTPKEAEPTEAVTDPSAQSGESAESPAPASEAPPAVTTPPPPPPNR
jgi:penicillin-binding protein 1A